MSSQIIHDYNQLIQIDSMLDGLTPKYPFRLNEQAKYTQHQITLYQSNYCHTETEPNEEQPSVIGGAPINIVLIDI